MHSAPDYLHTIERRPSWLTRALNLVTIHRARAAGEPLPACAVLLSPALDCTVTSPSMAEFLPEATLAIDHIAYFVEMHSGWGDGNARPVPGD